jgi:hypothetical protein
MAGDQRSHGLNTLLSPRAFAFLLELAEQDPPVVAAAILHAELGVEASVLVDGGLLVPGRPLKVVDLVLADGRTQAAVEYDGAREVHRCFHPEDGFVAVPEDRLRTWRLETGVLAWQLCRMLGLPPSRMPIPRVDGLLWDLGTPRLGRRTGTPVLFARRLASSKARVQLHPELRLRLGTRPSLLLSAGRWLPRDLSLPAISRIVPVVTVMLPSGTAPKLDLERLGLLADGRPALDDRPRPSVECTEDGSWLRVHEREYTFRRNKKRLIRLLYEAWARGQRWVGEKWLLAEADYDSKRIADVFKDGHADRREQWREFIEVREGKCRLRADDP